VPSLSNQWIVLAFLIFFTVSACQETTVPGFVPDSGPLASGDAQVLADAHDLGVNCEDKDSDGYCIDRDCNDNNAAIHPGAAEACNQLDDDCDQEIDEDLGLNRCGIGPCARELSNCVDGKPSICTPGVPQTESCNGIDDDCDGVKDNNIETNMSCGVGACIRNAACINGAWETCVPGTPSAETCNRIDDDCDDIIDEGFRAEYVQSNYAALSSHQAACDGTSERIGLTCNSAMSRFCAARSCTSSGFGPLENSADIVHIACLQAELFQTTFTELASHHAGCNGSMQRFGPDCAAAIHRFCISRAYISGYGPVEHNQDAASVACVSSDIATVIQGTYSQLSMHHSPCNGTTERFGPNCFAAVSRYCKSIGHVSGYGPVENFDDSAAIFCIDP
jgi:hypothetical protein